jgi:ubiquinone/menaquinone biosynthesis C-methylase UbiE
MINGCYRGAGWFLPSEKYSKKRQHLSLNPVYPVRKNVMTQLKKFHGGRILDVASGGGHSAVEVCRELKSWDHVTGVDLRGKLKDEFLSKFPKGKADFVEGDIRDLLDSGKVFDTILLGFSLHHLPNADELLSDLSGITSEKGKLIVLEMFNDDLTPAQDLQKRVHELAGRMDRLRGEYHAPVLSREMIDACVTKGGKWTIFFTEDDRTENLSNDLYKIAQTGEKLRQIAAATYKNQIPEAVQNEIDQLMTDVERIGMSSPPFRMVVARKC